MKTLQLLSLFAFMLTFNTALGQNVALPVKEMRIVRNANGSLEIRDHAESKVLRASFLLDSKMARTAPPEFNKMENGYMSMDIDMPRSHRLIRHSEGLETSQAYSLTVFDNGVIQVSDFYSGQVFAEFDPQLEAKLFRFAIVDNKGNLVLEIARNDQMKTYYLSTDFHFQKNNLLWGFIFTPKDISDCARYLQQSQQQQ